MSEQKQRPYLEGSVESRAAEQKGRQPRPMAKKAVARGLHEKKPQRKCSVAGCGRPHLSLGYCSAHWQRHHKHGNPMPELPISKVRPGSRNPNWKGGQISDGRGRVLVYCPNHPNPSHCGTHVYRYRLVMEKHLGRYLTSSEIVHHKNNNPSDDRIENLELCANQSEHCKIHKFGGLHK